MTVPFGLDQGFTGNAIGPWSGFDAYGNPGGVPGSTAPPAGGGAPGASGGGFDFSTLTGWPSGFPSSITGPNGYSAAANYLLQGGQQAQKSIRQGYEDAYTSRIQGMAGAQNEQNARLQSETAAGGYSPDLIRRMTFSSNANTLAGIGAAKGDYSIPEAQNLSQLQVGMGSELAGLTQSEIQQLIQATEAKQGLGATQQAGNLGFLGSLLGGVGKFLGSGPGKVATAGALF